MCRCAVPLLVKGERCSVSQYLTALGDRQVQYELDSWINELKQQEVRKRNAKSAARLRMQSICNVPQNWSYNIGNTLDGMARNHEV